MWYSCVTVGMWEEQWEYCKYDNYRKTRNLMCDMTDKVCL